MFKRKIPPCPCHPRGSRAWWAKRLCWRDGAQLAASPLAAHSPFPVPQFPGKTKALDPSVTCSRGRQKQPLNPPTRFPR